MEFDSFSESEEKKEDKPAGDDDEGVLDAEGESPKEVAPQKKAPPKADEYEWVWKVRSAVICLLLTSPLLTRVYPIAGARNVETYILPLTWIDTRVFIYGMSRELRCCAPHADR